MKQNIDLMVVNAAQLLTMQIGLDSIEDGALAVHDGRIVALGPTNELEAEYEAQQLIDAQHRVVSPGLVDCHTHLLFAGTREREYQARLAGVDYLTILQQGGGILHTVEQVSAAPAVELKAHGKHWLKEMLQYGVTGVEIKSGYGLSYETEKKMLECVETLKQDVPQHLIPTFLGAHTFPKEHKENPDEYIEEILERMLPDFKLLAEFCDVFLEQGAFSYEQTQKIFKRAAELGYGLKLHSNQMNSLRGVELTREFSITSMDHLDVLSATELDQLALSDTVAVLLPGASYFLQSQELAPARALLERGIPVALATDFNPGSSPCANIHFIMSLAVQQLNLTPEEAWLGVTRHAARAVHRDHEMGRLSPGLRADFVLWDMPNHLHPFYHYGTNFVEQVWIDGKCCWGGGD